jgi:hypothetical protein
VPPKNIWKSLLEQRPSLKQDKFYILLGTSNLISGGADGIDTLYAPYNSETLKVGVRVPILYMRTTKGSAFDWVFDPDFDPSTRYDNKVVAEDSLHIVMQYAVDHQLPVLFTLNGGVWGDARDTVPPWDLTDHLEEDPLNCQWNAENEVMPDDYLQHLPGSEKSPELARSLTLNVYAEKVRGYKKRNLQQSGLMVKKFSKQHPELFVGVNLDPDVYINPFFNGSQWYDYNPGTIRQFREWLQGVGVYAGENPVDLREYRREKPLSLEEVNKLAEEVFSSWNLVEPPRGKFWNTHGKLQNKLLKSFGVSTGNDYSSLWEQFRRHLVDLHYDELSKWLWEIGIDPWYIFSSQGFSDPGVNEPFPITVNSPLKSYDGGGMSVEGAVPKYGHLGAIIYGPSASNNIAMETDDSFFKTLWKIDRDWAVVEYNTANLHHPRDLPNYETAYRSLRDLFNFGARFVSPMAWNGSNGIYRKDEGFVAFTSFRNTPLEEAVRDFLISHANLPRRALLWTFGSARHSDADGWQAGEGTQLFSRSGHLDLVALTGTSQIELLSPVSMALDSTLHDLLVVGIQPDSVIATQAFYQQSPNTNWLPLSPKYSVSKLEKSLAGLHIPLSLNTSQDIHRIRLTLQLKDSRAKLQLNHIALYPKAR